MIPAQHLQALRKIVACLKDQPVTWVVTGSLGMALQGMPVEVHDIDLQTDQDGAYAIARLLGAYVAMPVHFRESERVRSHFGRLEMDGLQVEIMGDMQHRLEDGSWEAPAPFQVHLHWLDVEGMRAPVLSLEYEYEAYRKLGRTEKAEMLRAWLRK